MRNFYSIEDRGEAKYFHGREDILRTVRAQMQSVEGPDSAGGAMLLIQGAPGAGKSALLKECAKHAHTAGWGVADIHAGGLHNPHSLFSDLGHSYAKYMGLI